MNNLQISGLQKTYANGVAAIDNISLNITNGMFGLLGPNGAGKSTLMKTIAGLQQPDNGSILFNSVDVVKDTSFIKKQLGFLPQDFGVYPKISAYDLLNHLAILKGLAQKYERREQVLALLEKVNLYDQRKKEAHSFSGGMRQRFGIAQALLGNPKIVIVDEPTAGLDPQERNRFNNLLSEIGEDIIIILSTHLVEDVKNLCTQMAIMNNGRLVVTGKPTDFIELMKGKLWRKTIDRRERSLYEDNFQIISSQFNTGKLMIHVQSESNPGEGFESAEPALEDAYFSILQNKK